MNSPAFSNSFFALRGMLRSTAATSGLIDFLSISTCAKTEPQKRRQKTRKRTNMRSIIGPLHGVAVAGNPPFRDAGNSGGNLCWVRRARNKTGSRYLAHKLKFRNCSMVQTRITEFLRMFCLRFDCGSVFEIYASVREIAVLQ